ncbi:amidohydrolase family protein [Chloroflexota bacterium]
MESTPITKDDYFKFDCEAHLWPDTRDIAYLPGFSWQNLVGEAVGRISGVTKGSEKRKFLELSYPVSTDANDSETLIKWMDKYGVDMACALPTSGWGKTHSKTALSNSYVMEACEKYPDRLVFIANVGPITVRGLEYAIWDLEYLVKEKNCKLLKMYHPEDTYINDKQLWPFYRKVSDLGIPVCIHLGWSWAPPNLSKYCLTELLEEVATDFPDLKIIAYHAGWPNFRTLNMIAATHPNVYIGLNALLPWCITAPRRIAEIIGEAIQFASSERVLYGTDYAGRREAKIKYAVEGFLNFQIPEDMQEGYGFTPISDEDRRNIFGLNLAKLLGIEPKRRAPGK